MPGNAAADTLMLPVKVVPLTRGQFTIIDPGDYPAVSVLPWHANLIHGVWYAQHTNAANRTVIGMHTFLTGFAETDHLNGNGLDNRRGNLRDAAGRNSHNTRKHRGSSSRYKGVSWHAARHKWTAQITRHDVKQHLGYFVKEEDAARAYDTAAREHHGTFGRYNFPEPGEQSALR